MDEKLQIVLNEFRERWGLYIGKKSLERLTTFISGYMHGVYVKTGVHLQFLPGFQEYIADRYDIHTAHHWSEIIQFFFNTEEEAFDEFYILLDSFYSNQE